MKTQGNRIYQIQGRLIGLFMGNLKKKNSRSLWYSKFDRNDQKVTPALTPNPVGTKERFLLSTAVFSWNISREPSVTGWGHALISQLGSQLWRASPSTGSGAGEQRPCVLGGLCRRKERHSRQSLNSAQPTSDLSTRCQMQPCSTSTFIACSLELIR